MTSLSLILIHS